MAKQPSKSKKTIVKVIHEAFKILQEAGGEMRGKEVIDLIRQRVEFSDWEKERYEKTGYIRWESILHFYTVTCMKAGFLRKNKGVWILTDEGEEALKLGANGLLNAAKKGYKKWQVESQKEKDQAEDDPEIHDDQSQAQQALLDQYEEQAIEGIRQHIIEKGPYDFQDMVAALLRAMGYYTPFVASRGKDGGVDVIAYSDPLGTKEPRIKVQVKHKPTSAISVDDIRKLIGVMPKPGDVGLFVTSGRFSPDSVRTARESHKHVELVDFERFITLWQDHYHKMTDEEKNMLPLQPIYFLGANE